MFYDLEKCGERIRQIRIQSGYTQERLARELNIDQGFLSRIESGRKGCSVDLFVQLSELFHIPLDILVLGKDENDERRAQLKANFAELIDQLTQLQRRL